MSQDLSVDGPAGIDGPDPRAADPADVLGGPATGAFDEHHPPVGAAPHVVSWRNRHPEFGHCFSPCSQAGPAHRGCRLHRG